MAEARSRIRSRIRSKKPGGRGMRLHRNLEEGGNESF